MSSSYKPVKLFNFNFNLNLNLNFSIRPPRDEILFRTAIHHPVIFVNLNLSLNLSTSTHASDISAAAPAAGRGTSFPKTTPNLA